MVTPSALEDLRSVIPRLDWNAWHAALDRALEHIDSATAVELAERLVRQGLEPFERGLPGETWARRALDGQTAELSPECPSPGGNSFTAAVDALLDARAAVDPEACRAAVVQAIGQVVMAALVAIWAANHPEAWRDHDAAMRNDKLLGTKDPMWGWHEEPNVVEANIAMWNHIADRLEPLLSAPANQRS